MNILQGVSLKLYSTMRLGGITEYLVCVKTRDELVEAEKWAESKQLPVITIGSGSNIIWRDEGYKGLIIVNKIRGFKKLSEDETSATYQVGAGENWDNIVAKTVDLELQGIECLSLIPGTAGAAPVQNIGAYGQDVSQTLVSVEAYDRMEASFVNIANEQCNFGYRSSRFKTTDKGRFIICSITLKLSKLSVAPPKYADIQAYFHDKNIALSTSSLRKAVIAVRRRKLPDPSKVANCGSYFSNPIISADHFKKITKKYPHIKKARPGWPQPAVWELPDGQYKVGAGWLVEEAGFSAFRDHATGMKLWPKQNLVFINYKAQNTKQLVEFEQKITDKVYEMFQINLIREPEILP
ncbi:UDP-N-acetylmuramate dehydrogenase [Candidatus Saccharibacteria bacterium]|nr:UDP-N-acetylmuramate dehydrogenase [Candidatus Saccharibacteria bacterium]